jgi:hypothetical protein
MDTDKLLELGARGVHLLFDNAEIEAAFERDAGALREEIAGRAAEVQAAIDALLALDDLEDGRAFLEGLDEHIRHVLVLIYFDLLDTHVRRDATLH